MPLSEQEAKAKKQRRLYVTMRIAELQKELEELKNEKKRLSEEIDVSSKE